MRCVATLALFAFFPLFGQAPTKVAPPPQKVEQALRARVQEFYQDFVDAKFRKADALVANDSKEFFFAMEKVPYKSFEGPKSITYSDKFHKARVVVQVEAELRNPRFGTMVVRPDLVSTWELINGKWYWSQNRDFLDTPFGRRQIPKDYDENKVAGLHQAAGANPEMPPGFHMVTPEELARQIKVDKQNVVLSSVVESEDSITVTNTLPGAVTVGINCPPMEGLTIRPEKQDLKPGESVKFVIHHTPRVTGPKSTLNAMVHVDPLSQNVPLRIDFAMPRPPQTPGVGR